MSMKWEELPRECELWVGLWERDSAKQSVSSFNVIKILAIDGGNV